MQKFDPQDVPRNPGVYLFRNAAGVVIYVGKAKCLRRRLSSYFQPSRRRTADPKLRALLHSIESYEVQTTRTENEALLLEDRLVKQYAPRYNVDLRDDKRFLLIVLDPSEPFPRLQVARIPRPDGRRYFGPLPHARVARETVRALAEQFGLRTCRAAAPGPEHRRHCLECALRSCAAPCIGRISPAAYRERVDAAIAVLEGRGEAVRAVQGVLEARMRQAAAERDFEGAARYRDILANLHSLRTLSPVALAGGGLAPPRTREGVMRLQQALGLEVSPERIECFDISNIAGRFAVGSMVCFEGGRPLRRAYRHFRIRTVQGADDFAMLAEVVRRRCERLVREGLAPPQLLVLDGGPGQLSAVRAALAAAGLRAPPMVALAKRLEEVYLPGRVRPLAWTRDDPALQLLQALRDEAHRFALRYHLTLRRQRIRDSILDGFAGIGPQRRIELLRRFGSVKRLAAASAEDIVAAVPGLGRLRADELLAFVRERASVRPGAPLSKRQ
jgi:excinuclease ABC subunit C